jgi:molybdopterin-guanine dinucleotide biosynthesis protein A
VAGDTVVAVVLAGGAASDALAAQAGVAAKALVPFQGKPLGAYVLEALSRCGRVREVVYVGPLAAGLERFDATEVPAGERLSESLKNGFEAAASRARPGERVLVVTADLPWLRAEALEHFVDGAPRADVVYPAISREVAEEQFPDQARTYARFREGTLTGGNLALVTKEGGQAILPFIERFYRARKNPLALAALIGPKVLVNFALRRLSLRDVEKRVEQLLSVTARVVLSPHASLGADVDKPSHLTSHAPLPSMESV